MRWSIGETTRSKETDIMKTNAILAIALFASAPAFAQTVTAPAAKPPAGPAAAVAAPVKQVVAVAQPLDINVATVEQLAGVKGLTHTLAEAIVKGRPYKATDELVKSRILTEALFTQIKDGLTVKHN
jgi:competence protein ComEA